MTEPNDQFPVREQLRAGLEVSCSALRDLEAAARSTEPDDSATEGREHLARAIELLRQSIREMRDALDEEPGPPGEGEAG